MNEIFIAIIMVVGPGLIAWLVARKTKPSMKTQDDHLKAETGKVAAEAASLVQEQLMDHINSLIARIDTLEEELDEEREARIKLEAEVVDFRAWAKALEAQVIELGATPIPFRAVAT